MKKTLLSVIFALSLSVMFFVTASATETTKAEEWYNETHAVTGMIMEVTAEAEGVEVKETLYSKGEKSAAEVMVGNSLIRIITDSKDIIIFSPDMPYIHIKYRGMAEDIISSIPMPDTSIFLPTFVEAYEETVGETVYYVEEFVYEEENIVYKYYFIGDELDKIDALGKENGVTVNTVMDIISYEVDDSVFKVPWYSINIAFLVKLFGLFIL